MFIMKYNIICYIVFIILSFLKHVQYWFQKTHFKSFCDIFGTMTNCLFIFSFEGIKSIFSRSKSHLLRLYNQVENDYLTSYQLSYLAVKLSPDSATTKNPVNVPISLFTDFSVAQQIKMITGLIFLIL